MLYLKNFYFKDNRLENISPNNDSYKTVKTGLREFSTFVSKMVRQEFGCNFLALTRINELDRYTMQRIRGLFNFIMYDRVRSQFYSN